MTRVGDILSALFDEEFAKKAGNYSALFSCWKDMTEKNGIGAAADHSRIVSMERGFVRIEVDHPGWKQILQTKESKLLDDFCRRFPEMNICGLSIMLGAPEKAQHEAVLIKEESQSKNLINGHCNDKSGDVSANTADDPQIESIKDDALRESLKRLGRIIAKTEAEQK